MQDADFAKEVTGKTCLIKFTADWCQPCKVLEPYLEAAETKFSWLKVHRVDVDTNPVLVGRFGINSVPTLLFFKKGKVVYQVMGTLTQRQLDDAIREWLT